MNSEKQVVVTITIRTLIRVVLVIFATVLLFNFFSSIKQPLTLIFVSFFLALALNPAVSAITHKLRSKSRVRATAVAYTLVLTFLIAFFSLTIPPLFSQTRDFITDLPKTVENLQTQDSLLANTVRKYDLNKKAENAAKEFSNNLVDIDGVLVDTGLRIGSILVSIITVIVMTFMMLIEGPMWVEKFFSLMPKARRERRRVLAKSMYKMVTGFVNGQLLLVTVSGFFTFVTLMIAGTVLGVESNAVALAAIIIVFGLIPMIGTPIGAAIVVLMSLFSSTTLAIVMLIFFIVYQQIENTTVQPYIQSRQSSLTPLSVFIAALVGIGFGGILGAIVAIPVAGCIKILVEDYIARHKLGAKSA